MVTTTQQNAALVEEAAAAASSLDEQALRLGQAVSVFKVDTGARGLASTAKVAPQRTPAKLRLAA